MHVRIACFFMIAVVLNVELAAAEVKLPPAANRPIDFATEVRPIFVASCISCHGAKVQKNGFRLDQKKVALAGGDLGVAIFPGKSAHSALIQRVAGVGDDKPMPPAGKRLTAEQVGILRAWIDQGANWPDEAVAAEPKHWAYQPLVAPPVPQNAGSHWPLTPIDAFILAKLREKQLSPSPPADPRALIRRVYFDLIGLPPTPDEVAAFVADCGVSATQAASRIPQAAIAKVVDRLLASPHYGERWARHWLDVARYAETHGHDQDRPRPNAWPYRDYLIRSFNDDKPYARFVAEQVAGDVLFPNEPQVIAALGFLAAGPWDESSLHSIVDDTVDKKIAQVIDRDDMLTTVMTTFVSATVHCARCHNHKFDPITQSDYYALQAVFAGVDKAERTYDPDPKIHARRRELLAQKSALERGLPQEQLLTAHARQRVAGWEKSLGGKVAAWRILEPQAVSTKNGTKLVKQTDGSYLATEKAPDKDTYTFTLRVRGERITAVRLEALTDASLPLQGPGRQDNGNMHLSEFRVLVQQGAKFVPARVRRATADFNQDGWTIQHAIDGNPASAWGIYPNVSRPHQAIFELAEPLEPKDAVTVKIELDQLHGGRHLIGRPRLAFTDAVEPHTLQALPENIAAILKILPSIRTENQRLELARHVLRDDVAKQLEALPKPQMIYAATNDFKPEANFKPALKPRPVHVLRRGDINQPLEFAKPGTLACVPNLPSRFQLPDADSEGARRAALANWLADAKNALTWRSIVNRVWHYHFGRGLVDTPNDFGRMGSAPSHPELLDWLACWFRDHGGSLKQLHRMIVLSATYRQCSSSADMGLRNADWQHDPTDSPQSPIRNPQSIDADNRLLWRMNRARLDAESIRDAVLQITGKLDRALGGPSVKQFNMSPGIHVTPNVDYLGFNSDDRANYRRAVYRFVFRTLPDPFLEAMDCPDASQQAPVRSSSVTALQALAMLNDKFIVRHSEHLAERLLRERTEPAEQIRWLYALTLHRAPTAQELEILTKHAQKFGLPNVCRIVLNSNEFLFVP